MSTRLFITPQDSFLKLCGTIATFFLLTIQCTWTPEIKTPIHSSDEGYVALQTSSNFKRPPQHPAEISEALIKQLLQGIFQKQERGILQELFIADSHASPLFSPTQIEFLVPHLTDAFSQATPEELITFLSLENEEGSKQIRGTIAVFSPTIFLLTVQEARHSQKNLSKTTSSSRKLQNTISLLYLDKQAIMQSEEAKKLMTISSKNSWIAINYGEINLSPTREAHQEKKQVSPTPQIKETESDLNILREQVQDLRQTVDEQAEEIQRLQQTDLQ